MKTIKVNEISCLYSPAEVRRAETDAEVIVCLRDAKGNPIFSAMRARRIAGRKQWFGTIDEMKKGAQKSEKKEKAKEGANESGGNQKKGSRGRRKAKNS